MKSASIIACMSDERDLTFPVICFFFRAVSAVDAVLLKAFLADRNDESGLDISLAKEAELSSALVEDAEELVEWRGRESVR